MPTKVQLESALRNADKAGDIDAAKQLANALKSQQYNQNPPFIEAEEEPGITDIFTGASRMTPEMDSMQEIGAAPELNQLSMDSLKASAGLLTTGDTESLKGILSQQYGEDISYTEDSKGNVIVNLPSGSYALNKPGFSGQDLVRGLFDVAAFTPAARAGSIAKAAGGAALTEAAIEGTEESLGGDFDIQDVITSGALGGIFKGSEDLIGAGYRALKGSPESEIVESAVKENIPIMTTDAIPPKTFAGKVASQSGEKIPIAGTGGLRESQQAAREDSVAKIAEKYGQFSYDSIISSLKDQKNKVKSAAGNVLQSTGKKLDDTGAIPIDNTQASIAKVRDELSKKGVIRSEGAINDLNLLSETIAETPQTFTTLKENRTAFRDIVNGADKAERSQLSSRAKSLLRDVESSMTKDMDSYAKANLSAQEFGKWKKANSIYASEAQKLTKTRLRNVLDKGDVTPESVQTLLFSQKPSEVKNLYQSLTQEGKNNAKSAIITKVFDTLGRRAGGVTPNTFASEMKKQGLQVNTFFKGEEKKQLDGLIKVLDATRRAQDASVTTPTGQSLIGVGAGYAAFTDLFATLGSGASLGLIARIYESPGVRNALLRLDSIPKGSTRFEQALQETVSAMSASAQSIRDE